MTDYRKNGGAVGGGGGGAPSGTGVVTVTSGVFDVPSSTDDVVLSGLSGLVGGVLGEAVVGDGAGSVQQTSADVSALLGAADAAAARAAIAAAQDTAVQIATGASLTWTTVNGSIGGGSATASAGTITLTHDASVTSGWYFGTYTGPSARAAFTPTRGDRWRIQARIGTGANLNAGSRLGFGLYTDAVTNRLIHAIPATSIFTSHNNSGGNYNPVLKNDASIAANATVWVQITRLGAILTYEYGYSTGTTPPTTWSALWTETIATVAVTAGTVTLDSRGDWSGIGYTMVCDFWQPTSAPASAPVYVVDTITVWDL